MAISKVRITQYFYRLNDFCFASVGSDKGCRVFAFHAKRHCNRKALRHRKESSGNQIGEKRPGLPANWFRSPIKPKGKEMNQSKIGYMQDATEIH